MKYLSVRETWLLRREMMAAFFVIKAIPDDKFLTGSFHDEKCERMCVLGHLGSQGGVRRDWTPRAQLLALLPALHLPRNKDGAIARMVDMQTDSIWVANDKVTDGGTPKDRCLGWIMEKMEEWPCLMEEFPTTSRLNIWTEELDRMQEDILDLIKNHIEADLPNYILMLVQRERLRHHLKRIKNIWENTCPGNWTDKGYVELRMDEETGADVEHYDALGHLGMRAFMASEETPSLALLAVALPEFVADLPPITDCESYRDDLAEMYPNEFDSDSPYELAEAWIDRALVTELVVDSADRRLIKLLQICDEAEPIHHGN